MVEDVVDVDSINSFVVEFEVKEFARLLRGLTKCSFRFARNINILGINIL
jgi:hypothetical protein